jgi:hypothetical protein
MKMLETPVVFHYLVVCCASTMVLFIKRTGRRIASFSIKRAG